MIRLAALAAMALVLGGCDDAIHDQLFDPPKPSSARAFYAEQRLDRPFEGATVQHDDRRAVTCWVYNQGVRGGISCIPDWMLTAPKGGMAVRP